MHENEPFPCDLIVLDTALANGACFIETSSLDGEKNLKTKNAHPLCVGLASDKICHVAGMLTYELPNARLYNFDGSLQVCKDTMSCSAKQLLLTGAYLRNTP